MSAVAPIGRGEQRYSLRLGRGRGRGRAADALARAALLRPRAKVGGGSAMLGGGGGSSARIARLGDVEGGGGSSARITRIGDVKGEGAAALSSLGSAMLRGGVQQRSHRSACARWQWRGVGSSAMGWG